MSTLEKHKKQIIWGTVTTIIVLFIIFAGIANAKPTLHVSAKTISPEATLRGTAARESTIYFKNEKDSDDTTHVSTDKNGKFSIDTLTANSTYKVFAQKNGKKSETIKVHVRDYSDSSDDDTTTDSNDDTDNDDSTDTDESSDSDSESTVNTDDYNTGVTYDQIARTPDDYKNKKVTFSGEVAQVQEDDGNTTVRIAIDGDYDQMVIAMFDSSATDGSRVLEDDNVTFYGVSRGIIDYNSTMGGKISVPGIRIDKLTDNGPSGN
ncbi:hypothetical protein [Furfurilactobacillus entadae]|uniref:hypothetical protein n=1 Tax=Furfurilactobacillus entadae TaxID=2922307 RepID=UPI0035E9C022